MSVCSELDIVDRFTETAVCAKENRNLVLCLVLRNPVLLSVNILLIVNNTALDCLIHR